jgi:hypothetical protein
MLGRIGGQFVQNQPERGSGVGRQQDGLSIEAYQVPVVGRISAELLAGKVAQVAPLNRSGPAGCALASAISRPSKRSTSCSRGTSLRIV